MTHPISPFINRDLSWLEFNQRVLDEALNENTPMLERLKFLAITSRNLDEFFMVRVGSLSRLIGDGIRELDETGYAPATLFQAIRARVNVMVQTQYACFNRELAPLLTAAGIAKITPGEMSKRQQTYIGHFMATEITSVVTPLAIEETAPFPLLANLKLHLAVRLKPDAESMISRFAIVPLGSVAPRIVIIPSESGFQYMLLEEVVSQFITMLFTAESILECIPFRITRNAEISIAEDGAFDLVSRIQDVLAERKTSDCIRLEIPESISQSMLSFLCRKLTITETDVYHIPGSLSLGDFFTIAQLEGYEQYKCEPWPPQQSIDMIREKTIFDHIQDHDILLYHPYESFDPVVRLLTEAAHDPNVLAIKQILYRTAPNSAIITALQDAAEAGKYVTVLVELKARFDEARNIQWAQQLEQAGAMVIYGVKGLKTHAKATLIVRREDGAIKRYLHFGTGNYNEVTARLYADISFMTCNEDIGNDTAAFFNTITGYSQPLQLRKLVFAPISLHEQILQLIYHEKERKEHNQKSLIIAKMNSLVDIRIIEALYEASCAGVIIKLNVRGICCLRPGVKDMSENITVTSIVDRYLEHARIFYFYHGGDEKFFISSADWMPRNLLRRIELLVPIEAPACKEKLRTILDLHLNDSMKARILTADGEYKLPHCTQENGGIRSQYRLYQKALNENSLTKNQKRTSFEPHKPKKKIPKNNS
ncbi:MAG: polyphosphate kinase 1 [Chitinivibrionales bacterium]|nr:polyphosphate kinase 1 [Chitinivibrionales bacterium]